MKRRASPEEPLFRFHLLDAGNLGAFRDAIEDIHRGVYQGIIVRGVLDPAAAAEVTRRIEAGVVPMERVLFPGLEGAAVPPHTLGTPLMLEPQQDTYFASAAQFRGACRQLFAGLGDFEERIAAVLGQLAGGRPVKVATAGADAYTPSTIRVLPTGREIGVHVGNDFLRMPQAAPLAATVDVSCQLSFFVTLRAAEAGGELHVYGLEWADTAPLRAERGLASTGYDNLHELAFLVKLCDREVYKPEAGDLLLFDGGRWYHRVTPVEGAAARITIGGFLAFTRDGSEVRFWS